MKRTIDDPQGYIDRLRGMYVELFRTAHAIVGNLELAEYVLKRAIFEAYLRRNEWRERMGFREGLSQTVRMVAINELQAIRGVGDFEFDWTMDALCGGQLAQDALCARLLRENERTQRITVLYYGCNLRVAQIAQVMRLKPALVRDELTRLRTRLSRGGKWRAQGRHALESALETLAAQMLNQPGEEVPDAGQVYRAFERDAAGSPRARRSAGRIVAAVLCVLGALCCAALFWLVAVMFEPGTGESRDLYQQHSAIEQSAEP